MINNFHFPGQTVLTHLTLPYKLYFLAFYLVPLFTQWLTVNSLDTTVVLAAKTRHTGKDLSSATQGKSISLVVLWTILFLLYYWYSVYFLIKHKMHYQLRSAPASCLIVCLFFHGIIIYPMSIDLKM